MSTNDANDILMGGVKVPSAGFAEPEASWSGVIVSPPKAYQERKYEPNNPGGGVLLTYESGDPIMSLYVDIQTKVRESGIEDDDGIRRLYIQGKRMKEAVRNAVAGTGAKGLEVGATLGIKFTHREDPADKRSAKNYIAYYKPGLPAANDFLMEAGSGAKQDDFAAAPESDAIIAARNRAYAEEQLGAKPVANTPASENNWEPPF
jgi:hypothetical protein